MPLFGLTPITHSSRDSARQEQRTIQPLVSPLQRWHEWAAVTRTVPPLNCYHNLGCYTLTAAPERRWQDMTHNEALYILPITT
ncbi:hypothetical protein E2C01_026968 [Portunus trituberculatus]|uniref:Uncharacterized protein n=1 Tax=Portunus trituberculatus TaxID=210409 RepID=A0A5B7EKQ3_PORTR|nr:hypothetical protein [Portunus trituberculatus]